MPHFDPNRLTVEAQQRVARWLEANGCRHWIALEPVILHGNVVEYTALCRKDRKSVMRNPVDYERGEMVNDGRKRLRIRVPLAAIE